MSDFLQTPQSPNGQSRDEALIIDDSDDETDIERGNDDDGDNGDGDDHHHNDLNYICERVRQRAQETVYITRALEVIDDRHHTAWATVRHCLERLVELVTNNPLSVCIRVYI